jgi:hypothetical protein
MSKTTTSVERGILEAIQTRLQPVKHSAFLLLRVGFFLLMRSSGLLVCNASTFISFKEKKSILYDKAASQPEK